MAGGRGGRVSRQSVATSAGCKNVHMNAILAELRAMPLVGRCVIIGATSGITIGGIAGLILGLAANPPTAWFAVFEVGIPAGIAGGVAGSLAALIGTASRRVRRGGTPTI